MENREILNKLDKVTKHIDVLDHGFVELCNVYGDDYTILESARISTGGEASKGDKADQGLINYMYKNMHTSPFENVFVRLKLKMPIVVARQWVRHRTQSINEYSGRYSEMISDQYVPEFFKHQDTRNHQGSAEAFEDEKNKELRGQVYSTLSEINWLYKYLLEEGVSKEQARIITPVTQYTMFYASFNLWNLFHLLFLRLHDHAQWEIRQYAEAILKLLKQEEGIKWSVEIFEKKNRLDYLYLEALNKYKDLDILEKALKEFVDNG